jgi:SAM-dependent methyltransferase
MIEQAKRMNELAVSLGRIVLVQGPFSPLPWIDEMFDKVLLVNVVYFFDSDGRDMSEVYRVLRLGGRAVIYVTSRETMTKWPFAGPETHKLYDRNEILDLLVDAGFQPSDIAIEDVRLPFGIKGLLATAVKSCRGSVSERKHSLVLYQRLGRS